MGKLNETSIVENIKNHGLKLSKACISQIIGLILEINPSTVVEPISFTDFPTEGTDKLNIIMQPNISYVTSLAKKISNISNKISKEEKTKEPFTINIFFVPFVSPTSKLLIEQSIKKTNTLKINYNAFPILVFSVESKLLLCPQESLLRSLYLEGSHLPLEVVALSILELKKFICFEKIQSKGNISKQVIDIFLDFESFKKENSSDLDRNALKEFIEDISQAEDKKIADLFLETLFPKIHLYESVKEKIFFDQLLIIDREVDQVTPMLSTPLSYEALLNEKYHTEHTDFNQISLSVDKNTEVLGLTQDEYIYPEIRHTSVQILMKKLNLRAREFKDKKNKVKESKNVSELKEFVSNIPQLQKKMKDLSLHINLAKDCLDQVMKRKFHNLWMLERSIIEGENIYKTLTRMIWRKPDLLSFLKLVSLYSSANDGIPSKEYHDIKQQLINVYGIEVIYTFENLVEAKLIGENKTTFLTGISTWKTLVRSLNLIVQNPSMADLQDETWVPRDIDYLFSGYAPLSCRIIQLAITSGWEPVLDVVKNVPGVTICSVKQNETVLLQKEEKTKKKIIVYFVGGITSAEIAGIRHLENSLKNIEIYIMSTGILTGKHILGSLVHKFGS
eukprot:snap_masked-scaffold_11-processed-gene-2.20-mRNA-1 protein AED:1.00 eAED:1.00 QI:0/0/0/0/1/1/2/0/618